MASSVLVLEDDVLFNETLEDFLSQEGFNVDTALDPRTALELTYRRRYDVYLLDINLPYENGLSFLQALRQSGDTTPALFITSREDKASLIEGFRIGADDYLKKPVDLDELALRMDALLRRTLRQTRRHIAEDIALDVSAKRLYRNEEALPVSPKAVELLMLLLEAKGEVVLAQRLCERLWSADKEPSQGALRVYVTQLNKHLGKRIQNVRGVGYRYAEKKNA